MYDDLFFVCDSINCTFILHFLMPFYLQRFHFLDDVENKIKREAMRHMTYSYKENKVLMVYSGPELFLLSYTNILPFLASFDM